MSTPSQEFLMVVEESAFRTAVTTPTTWTTSTSYGLANAQAYYARLAGDNQFTMRPRKSGTVTTPYGGGVAIDAFKNCDKFACQGQLTMPLSISQAPFWLSWAGLRIAGGTAPWTTSEANGDLASCSVYHGIIDFNGTAHRRVYTGCKVDSWTIACSESSTIATLTLQLSASVFQGNTVDSSTDPSAGTFPIPADNNLPSDIYEWIHTSGALTIGGSSRAAITELNFTSNNVLARSWYNTQFAQYLKFRGRKTSIQSRLQYLSQADRTNYEALASETLSVGFNNGTHGFVIDCKDNNVYDPFEDDLKLADTYYQSNTEGNMWSVTAGADFSLAFT